MKSLVEYIKEGNVGTLIAGAGINNVIEKTDIAMAVICILVYGLIRQGFKQATVKKIGAEFYRMSRGIIGNGTDSLKKAINDRIGKIPEDEQANSILYKLNSIINDGNGNINLNAAVSITNNQLIQLEKEIETAIQDNEDLQNGDKAKAKSGLQKLIVFVRNLNKNENL